MRTILRRVLRVIWNTCEPYCAPALRLLWWVPNALTLARGCIIAPAIFGIFAWEVAWRVGVLASPAEYFDYKLAALALTLLAPMSDGIDGLLAKNLAKYGWQTDFGKRVDPLMDKWVTYAGFLVVPLHFGIGIYLIWFLFFAFGIDKYSRETTRMRKQGLILGANEHARRKTGYLFAAQVTFMLAVVGHDYLEHQGLAPWSFDLLMFTAAFLAMGQARILCTYAMRDYQEEIRERVHRRRQAFAREVRRMQTAA